MTLEEAKRAMQESRRAFGVRTTNKIFDNTQLAQPDMVTYEQAVNEIDKMRSELRFSVGAREAELEKAIRFNQRTISSIRSKIRANNPRGGTPYQRGKTMFDSPISALATGNCMEQSAVAAYRAITLDGGVRNSTGVVTIKPPGDHMFCIVGLTGSLWRNVASMKNDSAIPRPIVIDPWMNLVCYASQYPDEAGSKIQKWLSVGKRIFWWGNDQNRIGWYQPGGDYVDRFLDSNLGYEPAC